MGHPFQRNGGVITSGIPAFPGKEFRLSFYHILSSICEANRGLAGELPESCRVYLFAKQKRSARSLKAAGFILYLRSK
jgi:hypothetical protein